jgi:hypothetical protein
LTRAGAADINGAMLLRAPRLLQASVAAAAIAAFASWQPVMLANMAALHPHAGHATHAHGTPATPGAPGTPAAPPAPRHHPPAPQCCDLCPVACAATLGIPGAAPRAAALEHIQSVHPVVDREPRLPRARPHQLPFPIGPPTLRVA